MNMQQDKPRVMATQCLNRHESLLAVEVYLYVEFGWESGQNSPILAS